MENIICLDTNIIVDLIKNKNFNDFKNKDVCTTCINIFELSYWESPNIDNKIIIENFIEDIQTYGLNKDISILAGKIFLDCQKMEKIIDFRDVIIAAICIENKLFLKTNNKKHYEPLISFGLRIID